MKRLLAAGYRVQPQWASARSGSILVVEGDRRRVAIECDGPLPPLEKIPEDMERQACWNAWVDLCADSRHGIPAKSDRAMKQVFDKLEVGNFPGQGKKRIREDRSANERVDGAGDPGRKNCAAPGGWRDVVRPWERSAQAVEEPRRHEFPNTELA